VSEAAASERCVLVTGASRGIGRVVAETLAGRGWAVTLIARDERALAEVAAGLTGDGHRAFALDVADEEAWQRLAPELAGIGAVVCAAAILDPIGPVGTYSAATFRRTLDVNVVGTLLAVTACLDGLRAQRGSVVTFSGGGATGPLARFDAYAASKAAVVRLSENLAVELAADGVRVNSVAPGFVATQMHERTLSAGPELAGAGYFERTREELRRGGVPASEAAELVSLLLEDGAFSGKLLSAQWDPWRDETFRARLKSEPDLATLRRIDGMFFGALP
jgi:NAD(P)-dependent dehydrogenase (short-subunit alcohol dehydrogenase family)